jgi:hypothetical protein
MKLTATLVLLTTLGFSAPALACGPDDAPSARSVAPGDSLPNAIEVRGRAVYVDERRGEPPLLYVSYPREPGQAAQDLYGGFFRISRDHNYTRLLPRLERREMPSVRLMRARPGAVWRIVSVR